MTSDIFTCEGLAFSKLNHDTLLQIEQLMPSLEKENHCSAIVYVF